MFDIGWTELLVIACVTVLVVGPKELPGLLRTLGKTVGNLRKMAGDFQKQFDEAMREAELDEVRKKMNAPFQPLEDARKAALDFQQKVTDTVRIPDSPASAPAAAPAPVPATDLAASIPETPMAPQLATPPAELQAATAPSAPASANQPAAPTMAPAAAAAPAVAAKMTPKTAGSAQPASSGKAKAAPKPSADAKGGKVATEKVAAGTATGGKAKARTGRKS